jgi:hypothetical protein
MRVVALSVSVAALVGWTTLAAAQVPSAIVESVDGKVTGVEFLDYVTPGQVIKLGATGTIVLAYLATCVRETITGGVVVVGTDESKASLASINRERVACDTAQPKMIEAATVSGGMAFRNQPRKSEAPPERTIYSLSPLIDVIEPGKLIIERIDRPGERYEATLSADSLVKKRFHDLAAGNTQLKRGGVYAATLGSRKVVFRIDQLAEPTGPLLGRLLRL